MLNGCVDEKFALGLALDRFKEHALFTSSLVDISHVHDHVLLISVLKIAIVCISLVYFLHTVC